MREAELQYSDRQGRSHENLTRTAGRSSLPKRDASIVVVDAPLLVSVGADDLSTVPRARSPPLPPSTARPCRPRGDRLGHLEVTPAGLLDAQCLCLPSEHISPVGLLNEHRPSPRRRRRDGARHCS